MFSDFIKRLLQPQDEPMAELDAQLALTSLLVRLARSDGYYAAAEIIRIEMIAMNYFGMSQHEASELRLRAEEIESTAPDTVRFTKAIKDAVDYDDRLHIVEALWQVALSDGSRDQDEDALVRLVSSLIGVSDKESALARQRMSQRL